MIVRPSFLFLAIALIVAGGLLLVGRLALEAKSVLAEFLIDRALERHLQDGLVHRPWSWADLHPVARLEVPRLGVKTAVLTGATGGTLAFGLGHLDGTAEPGGEGNCVLSGHRDRQAAFLADLRLGDEIVVTTASGARRYRVRTTAVVDKIRSELLEPDSGSTLTLVTCYPFGGLVRSPWRYAVVCDGESAAVGITMRREPGEGHAIRHPRHGHARAAPCGDQRAAVADHGYLR